MIKALLLLFFALAAHGAWAQLHCSGRPEHNSEAIKEIVATAASSEEARKAFAEVKTEEDVVFCSAAVILNFGENARPQSALVMIGMRQAGTSVVIRAFRFLVENGRAHLLDYDKTTGFLLKWASGVRFRNAGALPNVDPVGLIENLALFKYSNSDGALMSAVKVRVPNRTSEDTYFGTWPAYPDFARSAWPITLGVIVARDNRTGELSVGEVNDLIRDIVVPLRELKVNP